MAFIINLLSIFLLSSFSANLAHTSDSDEERTFFDCEEDSNDEFYDSLSLLLPQEVFLKSPFEISFMADSRFMAQALKFQQSVDNIEFGKTFRANTSYAQLAAMLVELNASSLPEFPFLIGDWGCGQGYTGVFLLLAGNGNASLKLFDPVKKTAEKANSVLHKIATKYLAEKYKKYSRNEDNPSFTVSIGTGEQPPKAFMARQNDLNIAFNIMHMMDPGQCDAFLSNLYKNTKRNGIAMIVTGCFFEEVEELVGIYQQREQAGVRYPGYGIYIFSPITVETTSSEPSHAKVSFVSDFPKDSFIKPGDVWNGSHPDDHSPSLKHHVTDTQVCMCRNFLTRSTLVRRLEEQGFTIINSFYVNKNNSNLYPASEHLDVAGPLKDSILVIVEKQ